MSTPGATAAGELYAQQQLTHFTARAIDFIYGNTPAAVSVTVPCRYCGAQAGAKCNLGWSPHDETVHMMHRMSDTALLLSLRGQSGFVDLMRKLTAASLMLIVRAILPQGTLYQEWLLDLVVPCTACGADPLEPCDMNQDLLGDPEQQRTHDDRDSSLMAWWEELREALRQPTGNLRLPVPPGVKLDDSLTLDATW